MVLWIALASVLMNLIFSINSLNYSGNSTSNTKRVSAAIIGDFKIGFLVSVRLHNPGRKSTRNLECGKVSWTINQRFYCVGVKVTKGRKWKLCQRLTITAMFYSGRKVGTWNVNWMIVGNFKLIVIKAVWCW